jgi:hyperosmotically inducible protein
VCECSHSGYSLQPDINGNSMKKLVFASVLAAPALLIGTPAIAQSASQAPSSTVHAASATVAPDNAKSNQADPSNRDSTADKQKNDPADIGLVKRIRQSVMADKGLSTYAHNVKIVAVNGTVTLNGVVNTTEEKTSIGQKATAVAGEGHVVDELKVVPPK